MTISLDSKLDRQVNRALDYFEGRQQKQIDALAAQIAQLVHRLSESGKDLKESVTSNS